MLVFDVSPWGLETIQMANTLWNKEHLIKHLLSKTLLYIETDPSKWKKFQITCEVTVIIFP